MSRQARKKKRILVWQTISGSDSFACSRCSWELVPPDPKETIDLQRVVAEIERQFTEHVCSRNFSPKKFHL
jgi:hypothetical protein